jgi:hypothetical protein
MLPKPGKRLEETSSYRLINLLQTMNKIAEKEITPDTKRNSNPPGPSVFNSTEMYTELQR